MKEKLFYANQIRSMLMGYTVTSYTKEREKRQMSVKLSKKRNVSRETI